MSSHTIPLILVVIPHYLPGQCFGGPVRTISNMVGWLGRDFQFKIATSDHDIGNNHSYPDIKHGEWHHVGNAQVRYLSRAETRPWALMKVFKAIPYDVLYLDSTFDGLILRTLALYQLKLIPQKPVVLAPRGQLSPGAINLKRAKKRLFLALARVTGLYSGLFWHVSSEFEKADVIRELNISSITRIQVIPNLPTAFLQSDIWSSPRKDSGSARLVFLSRIVPKKNLHFLLERLLHVTGKVELDIYGPQEDAGYWNKCEALVRALPDNVIVTYRGNVDFDQVLKVLSQYHLFVLPTLSENFGHVILEALSAGCPVLISDQTPWRDLHANNVGWTLPLHESGQYEAVIQTVIDMTDAQFQQLALQAQAYGQAYIKNTTLVENTGSFLSRVFNVSVSGTESVLK